LRDHIDNKRSEDNFKGIYDSIEDLNMNYNNKLIPEFQKRDEQEKNTWGIGKIIKTILSFGMLLSLFGVLFKSD
jgi:hypothetical protein